MGRYQSYSDYANPGTDWLGEIPSHWKTKRLGALFNRKKETGFTDEELLSVYRDYGVIPKASREDNFNKPSDDLSPYQLVESGDLVLNKMKTWQGSIAVSEHRGIVSPAYFTYRPGKHLYGTVLCPKYVHYLVRSPLYIAQYLRLSKGIRVNQWDLDPDTFKTLELVIPPHDEQEAVAAFLDHETTKIDHLIAKQERLIELLKEKRQALISHAVTKGLNPDAPMKDSGVEWLGEVPAHWIQVRIKHVIRKIIDTEHKTAPFYDDGAYMVVRTSNVRDGKLVTEGIRCTNLDAYEEWTRRGKPEAGDILFTREAPAGQACLVPEGVDLCLGQRMVLFKVMRERVVPDFVIHSIYAGLADEFIKALSQGSTVAHFNMGDIGNIPLLEPPIDEQNAIVEYLRIQLGKFDSLMEKAAESVRLMQEHRAALISAAVTGKIDVRNFKPANA